MAEEVTIRVNQVSSGTALADAEARLKRLKDGEAQLKEGGNFERATEARKRIGIEEANIVRLRDAQNVAAKKEVTVAAELTREHREQAAIAKSRAARGASLGNTLASFAESNSGFGHFAGMSSGNPVARMIELAVATAIASAGYMGNLHRTTRLAELSDQTARATDAFRMRRLAGFEGSASAAHGEEMSAKGDYVTRSKQSAELAEAAKPRWWKLSEVGLWGANKFFGQSLQTPEGREADQANDRAKQRDLENQITAKGTKRDKFPIEGGLELEGQRARVEGRYKEAVAIDTASQALKRYRELRHGGGSESEAREGANLVLRQRELDVMRGLGSLARSGDSKGNIAALASLGRGFSTNDAAQRLERLITVVEGGQKAFQLESALHTHRR